MLDLMIEMPAEDFLIPLAHKLCKDRDEAVRARRQSGIETIWATARDQFAGIDEVNRDRSHRPHNEKSITMDGPIRLSSPLGMAGNENRSTVFVNITRPYTNAGTARVADILLPTGKMPWDLQVPSVSDLQVLAQCFADYPAEGEAVMQLLPELGAKLQQAPEEAKAATEEAKKVIKDWLEECDWLAEVREQIVEAGKVGTGVLKGPFPRPREISSEVRQAIDMLEMVSPDKGGLLASKLKNKLLYSPRIECIKVENCYPAPGCGRDVQNGKFFFEEIPDVSRRRLEELLEDDTYLPEQILACIKEGPRELNGKERDPDKGYTLWIRTGNIDLSDYMPELEAMEQAAGDKELSSVFLTVVLCNSRVIKIAQPMLDKHEFPYRMLLWETREDSWAGIGIPEQIETPQRGLNAAVRALMDNMGYSVGPQVLEVEDLIEPVDGDDTEMRPYKHWKVKTGIPGTGGPDDPTKAMTFLEFPNYLNEIMPVIQYWLKMAEDTTGLPLMLQGQATTDAVGVSQQLMNNSTTNLRLIVKSWDDCVCKPNIADLYEWCQLYGPETAKGDAKAVPLGSSTLLVKELQMQAMLQIGDRVVQPIYGLSPKKWMRTFLEGFQIDYDFLLLDEEERAQLEAAANQPDPRVEAAQVEAQAMQMVAQLKDATERLKLALDAQAKALSIQQAADAVDTQAAANITQEAIKQEWDVHKEKVKAALAPKPTGPNGSGAKPEPKPMDVDSALNALGLQ